MTKPLANPRPRHIQDPVTLTKPRSDEYADQEREHRCAVCPASVRLTVRDPLPPGWLVVPPKRNGHTDWALVAVRYLCPTCTARRS